MDEAEKELQIAVVNSYIDDFSDKEAHEKMILCIKKEWFDKQHPGKTPEELNRLWENIVTAENKSKTTGNGGPGTCECGADDWEFDRPSHQYICRECGISVYAHDQKTKEYITFTGPLEAGTILSKMDYKGKLVDGSWAKDIKMVGKTKYEKKQDLTWQRIKKEVSEALEVLFVDKYGVALDGPYVTQLYEIWNIISRYIVDQEETFPTAGNSSALQVLILERLFILNGYPKINADSLRTMFPYEDDKVSNKNMLRMIKFFNEAIENIPLLEGLKLKKKIPSDICLTKGLTEKDMSVIDKIENTFEKKSKKGKTYNKFIAISYYLTIHSPERGSDILKLKSSEKATIKNLLGVCPIEEISFRELNTNVKYLKDYFSKTKTKSL